MFKCLSRSAPTEFLLTNQRNGMVSCELNIMMKLKGENQILQYFKCYRSCFLRIKQKLH